MSINLYDICKYWLKYVYRYNYIDTFIRLILRIDTDTTDTYRYFPTYRPSLEFGCKCIYGTMAPVLEYIWLFNKACIIYHNSTERIFH